LVGFGFNHSEGVLGVFGQLGAAVVGVIPVGVGIDHRQRVNGRIEPPSNVECDGDRSADAVGAVGRHDDRLKHSRRFDRGNDKWVVFEQLAVGRRRKGVFLWSPGERWGMADLDIELVVVPVDGSPESTTAVEYAVAIADRYDAAVHAVYVLGEPRVRGLEDGTVTDAEIAADTESFSDTLDEIAADAGVDVSTSITRGFSTEIKTLHPGSVVLDTAEELGADFVVVPREPVDDIDTDVLAKAAEYVLLYASQPVLSV